jgi:hypothetical protein
VFGSPNKVTTGQCLGNSGHFGQGSCPSSAGRDFDFTEGPVPAAGGSVSNLQAEAGAAPAAGKNATVNLIDETPSGAQTVAMTCTVSGGATTCSNTGTVAVTAGHYLMVRIDTTSLATTWRVGVRY